MRSLNAFLWAACAFFSYPPAIAFAESTCYGTVSKGKLVNGVQLPSKGKNFSSYSALGNTLGRTYVHEIVHEIVLRAYDQMVRISPQTTFVYGETGFASGGRFRPHRTHQNGLSVDFMVPVKRGNGQSVPLPTSAMNKFGYGIEFDNKANFGDLSIDFVAMAEYLYQLDLAAKQADAGIDLVIFDPQFLGQLFATKHGVYLKQNMHFLEQQAWVRHDEHFHVDFKIPCKNMP
jgi:penicillin-insensitive murein DD-endopeptidase